MNVHPACADAAGLACAPLLSLRELAEPSVAPLSHGALLKPCSRCCPHLGGRTLPPLNEPPALLFMSRSSHPRLPFIGLNLSPCAAYFVGIKHLQFALSRRL